MPEQVLEEVLVALGRRAEQVGPPDRQDPREVLRRVRVLAREAEPALLELVDDVRGHRLPRGRGLVGDVVGVAVEGRVGRHPAHPRALRDQVGRGPAAEPALPGARGQRVGADVVVAELVGVQVPVRRLDHLPRRARPVQAERQLRPPGDRAALLLAHVVRPAAAVDALAAGQRGQREEAAVDRVRVEPVVGPGPHQDHRPAAGVLRVLRELPGDARGGRGGDAGDALLPGRRVRRRRVVVAGGPLARQAGPPDAVLREHQVEHRGHQVAADPAGRHAAQRRARGTVDVGEPRQLHLDGLVRAVGQREPGVDALEVEVPPAGTGLAEAVAERAVGHDRLVGAAVHHHGLEVGVLDIGVTGQVRRGEELPGPVGRGFRDVASLLLDHRVVLHLVEPDQAGQVGVALGVVGEVRRLAVDEELPEDHVAHRHGERRVGAGPGRQPLVGELHVVGVVGSDGDHLLAAVARLGHPVRVRGAGDRHVGAPHDQVAGVPPVPGLGHVGLVAEHLRRGDGQVGVPVVERQHRAADQRGEAGARGVRHHRHRRDRREAGHPVRAPLPDRVHVGRGDHLGRLVPGGPHQPALAARGLVGLGPQRVVHHVRPRLHRVAVVLRLRLAVHLQQHAADVGVTHPGRRVGVPGEGGAARAAAGLVVGAVGAG